MGLANKLILKNGGFAVGLVNFVENGTNIAATLNAGQLTEFDKSFEIDVFGPGNLHERTWPHFDLKFLLSTDPELNMGNAVEVSAMILLQIIFYRKVVSISDVVLRNLLVFAIKIFKFHVTFQSHIKFMEDIFCI